MAYSVSSPSEPVMPSTPVRCKKSVKRAPLNDEQRRLAADYADRVRSTVNDMVAHGKVPKHLADEAVGWANLGLMDAARLYRADRGANFWSFAERRVRGAVSDGLRDWSWHSRSDAVADSARVAEGHESQLRRQVAFTSLWSSEAQTEILDGLTATRAAACYAAPLRALEQREAAERILAALPPVDADVLRQRIMHEIPQVQVAAAMGLSDVTVRSYERRALRACRECYVTTRRQRLALGPIWVV